MLAIGRSEVLEVLEGAESDVLGVIEAAYVAHARGLTSVPHSSFLRFPGDSVNRIIALPSYVGGGRPLAGIKWISSFPGNLSLGKERASAAILLNRMDTGEPTSVLEGSVISAKRTAASAALAARVLMSSVGGASPSGVSLIGAGVINTEVTRFLRAVIPGLTGLTVHDASPDRAKAFAERHSDLDVAVVDSAEEALAAHRLVSVATTATTPHLDTGPCAPGTVVLHLSLRDLFPEAVLRSRNVVDDTDHVCRAATSLELAERSSGDRGFVHAEIGSLLSGDEELPADYDGTTVFSPFGLGVLDTALAGHVVDAAHARGLGTPVPNFLG
ncbi:2,3-diaminopropionate biosynthesis protein SbnB [Nocardiopsis dassonvillei]